MLPDSVAHPCFLALSLESKSRTDFAQTDLTRKSGFSSETWKSVSDSDDNTEPLTGHPYLPGGLAIKAPSS